MGSAGRGLILAVVAGWPAWGGPVFAAGVGAAGQGVDCDTASSALDRLICSDPGTRRLDREMWALYGDVLADGKASRTDTSGIVRRQRAWRHGRVLCTNVTCLKAYYGRRLETLKADFVTIHQTMAVEASKRSRVNRHTYVGVWNSGYGCDMPADRLVVERHMIKVGKGGWQQLDHQADDTYHGLPVFYVVDGDSQANIVYDTHVDTITFNKGGFGAGSAITYTRCE